MYGLSFKNLHPMIHVSFFLFRSIWFFEFAKDKWCYDLSSKEVNKPTESPPVSAHCSLHIAHCSLQSFDVDNLTISSRI